MNFIGSVHWFWVLPILGSSILLSCIFKRFKAFESSLMLFPPLALSILYLNHIKSEEAFAAVQIEWIKALNVSIDFYLHPLAELMLFLILGIGFVILIYAKGYFESSRKYAKFQTLALCFMFAMSGVVLSNNLILAFIFWELTGILSFFLVAFYYEKELSRESAKRALLVTTAGGLFLLAGFIMLGHLAGTYRISDILIAKHTLPQESLEIVAVLIILGCITKSAQFPFHFWLPGAMSAPTPASAYLHSATMVKAGVFLLALLQPVFSHSVIWTTLLISLGSITLTLGAYQSILCKDLKAILAYTTIGVLGALVLLIGIGTPAAIKATIILLVAHALYKATLFMIAGLIDSTQGTRDLSRLGGLRKTLLLPSIAAILAALSMSGIPGTLGFLAKEYTYKALIHFEHQTQYIFIVIAVIASALMMYSALQVGLRPFGKKAAITSVPQINVTKERIFLMTVGPLLLALSGIVLGVYPEIISKFVVPITKSISNVEVNGLKLWHGMNTAFVLSLITIAIGLILWFNKHKIKMTQFTPLGTMSFDKTLSNLGQLAVFNSNYLKRSSLTIDIVVILSVTMILIWYKLIKHGSVSLQTLSSIELMPALFCILLVIGAILSCTAKRTKISILYLSICGISTSMLFMVYGAPDLAITQISVDVLLMILFVAILSKIPDEKTNLKLKTKLFYLIFSIMVGLTLSLIILKSLFLELSKTISSQLGEWSYQLAHGANVVNVILVDFRSIDTLGEITVLCIAALGISALSKKKIKSKEITQ